MSRRFLGIGFALLVVASVLHAVTANAGRDIFVPVGLVGASCVVAAILAHARGQ